MSLLARNALVLGSERRITPQMGTSGSKKSDGLIKDSSGGLVLPKAMSQKECNSKKRKHYTSVTKASTKEQRTKGKSQDGLNDLVSQYAKAS